jgi:hypothetical protein
MPIIKKLREILVFSLCTMLFELSYAEAVAGRDDLSEDHGNKSQICLRRSSSPVEVISRENSRSNFGTSYPVHGRLVILYGTSTSGKTSIGRELERMGWVHMELDNFCSKKLFSTVKAILPHDYETCEKYLTKIGMLHVFLGNRQQPIYRNPFDVEGVSLCSVSIANILSKLGDVYKEVSVTDILQEITEESLRAVFERRSVVLDAFLMQEHIDIIKFFLRDYPATFILNYCPFRVLCARVLQRNVFAYAANPDEFRSPTMVFEQFASFYRPRRHLREVNLGVLSRKDIDLENRRSNLDSIGPTWSTGDKYDLFLKKFGLKRRSTIVISTDFLPDYMLNSEGYEPQDCAKFIIAQEALKGLEETYRKSFSAQLADLEAFYNSQKNQRSLFILMGTSSSGKSSLLEEFARDNRSVILLKTRELWKNMVFDYLRQRNKEAFDSLFQVSGDSLFGFLFCSLDDPIIGRKFKARIDRATLLIQLETLQNLSKPYIKEFYPKRDFLIPELVRRVLSLGKDVVLDNVPNKQDLSFFSQMNPSIILVYCSFDKLSSRIEKRNLEDDVLEWRPTLGVYEEFASFFRSKEPNENIKRLGSLKRQKILSLIDAGFKIQAKEGVTFGSLQRAVQAEELGAFKLKILKNIGFSKAEKVDIVPRYIQPNFVINTSCLTPRKTAMLFDAYIRWAMNKKK